MSDPDQTLLEASPPASRVGPEDCTVASEEPAGSEADSWGSSGEGSAPGAPPSPPSLPGRAGEYLLRSVLAEGGLGVVYRGQHAVTGAPAAIQIPHAELATHPVVLARFEREIEAIRRLQHPNVVRILGAGRLDDGRPYFAMELLAGVSLHEHLHERGRLPVHEALSILEPVCAALEAAHEQDIIHRDIKPSNVFLVDEGEGRRRVVLLDFGVAKLLDVAGPALTTSRQLVGTVAYMSPEQLLGMPVEACSDVYALGALLYTMLVGERPFDASASADMRRLLLQSDAPRPSLLAPVHAAFDEVVQQAMRRDPATRHPSAATFLAHLRRAAEQAHGAPTAAAEGRPWRALGVYVELLTEPGALEAPDARLLEDVESILPAAYEHLEAAGLSLAVETGNGALLVAERPAHEGRDAVVRRAVLDAACSLHRRLARRDSLDPRVRVHLSVHAGELVSNRAGDVIGGDLLDLPAWIPEDPAEGVFASAPLLIGLNVAPHPMAALVRVA